MMVFEDKWYKKLYNDIIVRAIELHESPVELIVVYLSSSTVTGF
jgi:hypothetical protein